MTGACEVQANQQVADARQETLPRCNSQAPCHAQSSPCSGPLATPARGAGAVTATCQELVGYWIGSAR